ncbi:MAG: hypothetical protein IJP45_07285 [Paludibacteraceae bacterium]|nr:hypothetical protein [Paludibacteraceae bacterium]
MKKLKRLEKTYYYKVMRALVCVCACAIYILGLSGCNQDEPKNVQKVTFPISFCLPASEVYGAGAPSLRAFGDPGTTEQFALPQYLYIFIVKYVGSGEEGKATLTNWQVWKVLDKTPSAGEWEKKRYTGAYANVGDSIFQYTEEIILLLNGGSFDGRVYAVASAVPLTLPALTEGTSTLADVLGMTFSFKDEGTIEQKAAAALVKANLQNIYSTPYNYTGSSANYYGSFFATQNVPHLDLLLYHVAAKVDLMWNVKENLRGDVKISYIAAEHLYDGPCYVFKPTENEVSAEVYASGYAKEILNDATPCPGTQWNGRKYFYAIPYKNNESPTPHYPLQLTLCKGTDRPAGGHYYSKLVKTDIPEVWTSWIRGQISINTATYNVTP